MIEPKLWVVWLCMVVVVVCCGKRRRPNEVLSFNHVTERERFARIDRITKAAGKTGRIVKIAFLILVHFYDSVYILLLYAMISSTQ